MRLIAVSFPVVLAAALLQFACASAPPMEHTRYLMRAPGVSPTGELAQSQVGIRRITVAPYLQGLGLVVETEPGRVQTARFHQWVEPLNQGLRRFLVPATSAALGEPVGGSAAQNGAWTYSLDLYVDQMHGTAEGEALLVAEWRIVDRQGEEATRARFEKRRTPAGPGYGALAQAELALVGDLAGALADALRGLPRE